MIEIKNVSKKFEGNYVLENISCTIQEGSIYGLIGANGAGKSTLLRIISGVYKPESGTVLIDGEPVYENPAAKVKLQYVSDELYFLPGASLERMAKMYASLFPGFSKERFAKLSEAIGLDRKKSISTFSKGMKRQAAIILALSTMAKYVFLDETFDGLDPVMRNAVKKMIMEDVMERNTTIILTSHSLRELEDTCDQLSLLHKGGIVFERDIQDLKCDMFKLQIGFNVPFTKELFAEYEVLSYTQHGSIASIILKGDKDDIIPRLYKLSPVLIEALPLSLEEIFVYEMEARGYSFNELLGGEK